ncbi:MAG: UDP-N-acetylmuramate--L-alanine ligase [Verrucomicrobia bacterium]|nr:UDP-N-acetylmuramate--L-alanine ligase [Verrucomicrobiota bacterium]
MNYHFIGLGGIGMSALARILLQKGDKVRGSDLRSSPLLDDLQNEGAEVQIGHSADAVSGETTIVYSTDVKGENVEFLRAQELNLPMMHRSDLLHLLMKGKKPLLITGTHGKTTTTGLLAKVLMEAGFDPSFVVGGILHGLKTNGKAGSGDYFVAEADESDGSFLKTPSYGAIVTNLEDEHLSYWKGAKELDQGFARFFAQVQKPEHLFWCADDERLASLSPPGFSYGFSKKADWRIERFQQGEKGVAFNLCNGTSTYPTIEVSLFGRHNALNAAAVFALALSLNADEASIRKGLKSFSGVARRLEFKGESHRVQLFDDYGHHPTEIAATISALRGRVGERRLIVVFQPHRYSRVRDLFEEFFTCFHDADEVVLTDIYSAGEAPIEGITTAGLYMRMREKLGAKLHYLSRLHLETGVAQMLRPHDVVLTIGAGDVTKTGEPILRHLAERSPKWRVGLIFNAASLNSAKSFSQSLDPSIYEAKLFGVTEEGNWICEPDAFDKIEQKIHLSESPKISAAVLESLTLCEIVFPFFLGVQGLLEVMKIPYAGSTQASAEFCKNRLWLQSIASDCGLPFRESGNIVSFFVCGPLLSQDPHVRSLYRASGCRGLLRIELSTDSDGYFGLHSIEPFPPFDWNRDLCDQLAISALRARCSVGL